MKSKSYTGLARALYAPSVSLPVASGYSPAKPVGGRCSHACLFHDGRKENTWDIGIQELRDEMAALKNNRLDPQLSHAQHIDYWSSLCTLTQRGVQGSLSIGRGGQFDADVLQDIILELKPSLGFGKRAAFGKRPRKLRLYFGEPLGREYVLLALHLDTKEADESGLDEQDDAIQEAIRRAHVWAQGEHISINQTKRVESGVERED